MRVQFNRNSNLHSNLESDGEGRILREDSDKANRLEMLFAAIEETLLIANRPRGHFVNASSNLGAFGKEERNRLDIQSANDWKEKQKIDPDLEQLGGHDVPDFPYPLFFVALEEALLGHGNTVVTKTQHLRLDGLLTALEGMLAIVSDNIHYANSEKTLNKPIAFGKANIEAMHGSTIADNPATCSTLLSLWRWRARILHVYNRSTERKGYGLPDRHDMSLNVCGPLRRYQPGMPHYYSECRCLRCLRDRAVYENPKLEEYLVFFLKLEEIFIIRSLLRSHATSLDVVLDRTTKFPCCRTSKSPRKKINISLWTIDLDVLQLSRCWDVLIPHTS